MKKNLFKSLQTLLVFGLAFTLTGCWNTDNALEDIINGSGGATKVAVTGITLDPTTLEKKVGDEAVTLTATVKPDDATDKTVTWTSDKESVATVDETGKVTFVGAGTAIIKATAKDGSGIEGKCTVTVGLLTGMFTVADGKQVKFAQGNLQATTTDNGVNWTWAFAENQWDNIGAGGANGAINEDGTVTTNGTVDLFGWVGASSTWEDIRKYGITTSTATSAKDGYGDAADESLKSDWGTNMGPGWRTLDIDEWTYLFNTRTTDSGIRYAKATVNGVPGVILLPDDWSDSYYALTSTNTANAAFTTNDITSTQWTSDLDAHGAVFLPAAGYRTSTVKSVGTYGYYWTSTPSSGQSNKAQYIQFGSSFVTLGGNYLRNEGHSVRVVHDVVK